MNSMTEINIAIAKSVGWKIGRGEPSVRNYCTDLNAMHEAERTISGLADQLQYLHLLSPIHFEWTLATATARQRAEAFLRVKGLWK